MSRRHHGGRPHRANGHSRPADVQRPAAPAPGDEPRDATPFAAAPAVDLHRRPGDEGHVDEPLIATAILERPAPIEPPRPPAQPFAGAPDGRPAERTSTEAGPPGQRPLAGPEAPSGAGCTAPQLRRFIKSRPYVPMHELRRRFGINGGDDEVTLVRLAGGQVFVGLPDREGALLGELLRAGEIGYELSLDPRSPIVVGLYPMRPVARS